MGPTVPGGTILVIVLLEGSYRVWSDTDRQRQAAVALAETAPPPAVHAPTFVDNKGTMAGNEISNTYGAGGRPPAGGTMLNVGDGSGVSGSLVTIEVGPPETPVLPTPEVSTPDERAALRAQLVHLAEHVEHVMAPWQVSSSEVAAQMGIPPGEFVSRHAEVRAEVHRILDETAAEYNAKCRSAVVQAYGHARTIGFADAEMERVWRTRIGAGAQTIPARLQAVASQIADQGNGLRSSRHDAP